MAATKKGDKEEDFISEEIKKLQIKVVSQFFTIFQLHYISITAGDAFVLHV